MIQELQDQASLSTRAVGAVLGLGYRRILRWQQRTGAGSPALVPPGPRKIGPLPLEQIAALQHGARRSRGTGELYAAHCHAISRREFGRLVARERQQRNAARKLACKHVLWHRSGVAWAIDATEHGRDRHGHKLFVHAVQDLCSHYRFAPLVALESNGTAIAKHLAGLFRRHGPPLFLKRDNGSPLNHADIDAVLAQFGVIPLNSPAHYPQYNGAVEHGIGEVKSALGQSLDKPVRWKARDAATLIEAVDHELNCRPRRSLHGQSACQAWHHRPRARFTKRQRQAVFEWMRIHASVRIRELGKVDRRSAQAAWRAAAESWLTSHGLVTISTNQKSVTQLPNKKCP